MAGYIPLTLKYRPQFFRDLVGQEVPVKTIQNMLKSGRLHPSLIFGGSRGTGKTTTARILSRALNCGTHDQEWEPCGACKSCKEIMDEISWAVQEIDAASQGGVDDIRRIKTETNYTQMEGQYRVWVIDECHAMTSAAWQAFLKLLEEPPPRVIFVFASTETHKIPETIASRSMIFPFVRIPVETIVLRLQEIVTKEQFQVAPEALLAIARSVQGGMRDAISLLDQLVTYSQGAVTEQHVREVLGVVSQDIFFNLATALVKRQTHEVYAILQKVYQQISDVSSLIRDFLLFYRDLALAKLEVEIPGGTKEYTAACSSFVKDLPVEYLLSCQHHLQNVSDILHRATLPARAVTDMGMLQLFYGGMSTAPQAVVAQPVVSAPTAPRPLSVTEVKDFFGAQLAA